jgi:hypothetical protein
MLKAPDEECKIEYETLPLKKEMKKVYGRYKENYGWGSFIVAIRNSWAFSLEGAKLPAVRLCGLGKESSST